MISNIELRGGNRQRIEHTAIIGMGIIEGYRFAGLGTRMMEIILEWAIDHPMIKHLWLQVFGNHQLAIALYERFGFKECGRQKDFIQKSDNSFVDKVNMCREV